MSWTRILSFWRKVMSEAMGHDSVCGAKAAIINISSVSWRLDRSDTSGQGEEIKKLGGDGVAAVGNVLEWPTRPVF